MEKKNYITKTVANNPTNTEIMFIIRDLDRENVPYSVIINDDKIYELFIHKSITEINNNLFWHIEHTTSNFDLCSGFCQYYDNIAHYHITFVDTNVFAAALRWETNAIETASNEKNPYADILKQMELWEEFNRIVDIYYHGYEIAD